MNIHQMRSARAYLNWSQKDLGFYTDLSQTQIARIENGTIDLSERLASKIESAFYAGGIQMIGTSGIQEIIRLCAACKEKIA